MSRRGSAVEAGWLVPDRGRRSGLAIGRNSALFRRVGRVRHGVAVLEMGAVDNLVVPGADVSSCGPGGAGCRCDPSVALLAAEEPIV